MTQSDPRTPVSVSASLFFSPMATDDGDDDGLTKDLQQSWVPSMDDGSDLEAGEVRVTPRPASGSGETASRAAGGWAYSIQRLLQSALFAHYLRCAGEFARAVIYAVGLGCGV